MELGFSLRTLATVTRLPPRLVQFWTDHKVLRPLATTGSSGRGIHRLYSMHEVEIANILANVTGLRLNIATIKAISDQLRPTFEIPYLFGFDSMEDASGFLREHPHTNEKRKISRSTPAAERTTWREHREAYTEAERQGIRDWIGIQRARRHKGHAHLLILVRGDTISANIVCAESLAALRPPDNTWWDCYLVVDLGKREPISSKNRPHMGVKLTA